MGGACSMMKKNNSGQTLLIIVLIASVILTVGLAVATYSITDIKISQQEEESARAFAAAEAGIEESLKIGSATNVTIQDIKGDITAKVSEMIQGGPGIRSFDFGGLKFASGELTNIWFVEHNQAGGFDPSFPSSGKITICWGEASQVSSANPPAIETSLVYKDGNSFKVIRAGFDPKNARTTGFGTVDSNSGSNCGNLAFAKDIDLTSGTFAIPATATPYLLRMKLLYNTDSQPLAVTSSTNDLPTQGKCYDSAAAISGSGITRKIKQCRFFEAPPAIFDYVLFSNGSLVK
jgi:hypothetical protein